MSTITQLLNNNFGGIRQKDAYFTEEKITCSDCQNIELFYTGLNSGVGIRTASGNIAATKYTQDIALDVYEFVNDELIEISQSGYITGDILSFTINQDEFSDFERDEENDFDVAETTYFAFKNENRIVYTLKEKNEQRTLSIIPDDEQIIEIFETVQDTITYLIAYTESATQGKLYNINLSTKTATLLVSGLSVTGKACGTDFVQGWRDMFVFSNGINVKYIYTDTETHEALQIEDDENVRLIDQEGRTVKGLGLINFNDRLWIFDGKVLWYSEQGECRNFLYNETEIITSAGYMEFVKNITAIYPYLGSLAVFHKDSSVLVVTDNTTIFARTDESPGGCANYRSLVFHGTDLYFYDDTKKGVFSFKQIVNGDKTLGDNIALDIQEELMQITLGNLYKIKALSVVTADRNEVWFITPINSDDNHTVIMIYDYLRGEWIKRVCQQINTASVITNTLYSAGKDIYEEYNSKTFDGEFIQSYYTCSTLNLGADNTMKITKFPPRLCVDGNEANNFYVKYVKNYNYFKTPKIKLVKSKTKGDILTYDTDDTYDDKWIYIPDKLNAIVKMPSATFKALEITFYTENENQFFGIKSIEFSKIKVKQV